ncbi:MAG: RnfABCDGE type electron transport complex subunit B [Candidatus Omnitrophota bacterium]
MLISILTMSIMGLLFGLGLAYASRIFRVDVDPKIDKVLDALPGANCGACGMAGCAMLAEAIVQGKARVTACAPGGQETYDKIAGILGVQVEVKEKAVARVRCNGGRRTSDKYNYTGVKTCAAANLLNRGQKACGFGCLGFGDCVNACPFDAIRLNINNIPEVDASKCTACGKCVEACPKNIIILGKVTDNVFVKCLSRDKGAYTKSICPAGCIGCRICEKLSGGVFVVEDNLSRVDWSRAGGGIKWDLCIEKCPARCIVKE